MDNSNATNDPSKNPDPITGEPGSHPLGTGIGTTGGGVAGAAIGGVIGGPIGAVVGAVVGGIAGAAGGHGVAEAVNPTREEAFWRENHAAQSYADRDSSYDTYAPAYRTGYEGVTKYSGKSYDEIETDLARDYEKAEPGAALPWDKAKPAVRAAWDRVSGVNGPRDADRGTRGNI